MSKKEAVDEARISKIVLELGRKTIELTPDQAKKLHEVLNEMYGEKVVRHVHDGYWYWRPNWYYGASSNGCTTTPNITWGSFTTTCSAVPATNTASSASTYNLDTGAVSIAV